MNDAFERMRAENMEQHGFGPEAMKKIKVCSVCGTSAKVQQHFCRGCGRRLPDKTLFDLYRENHPCCRSCGTVVTDSAHFCPQCGAELPMAQNFKPKETLSESVDI